MCSAVCTVDLSTETLAQLAKKEVPDNTGRNMIVATLYTLTNIMYQKPRYLEAFFELQGELVASVSQPGSSSPLPIPPPLPSPHSTLSPTS